MTPQEFIAKWQRANLSERSAYQQHFLDLCEVLGQPTPAAADPDGVCYTFERGVRKTSGEAGWADVWMQGHFGWEYKGKHKDLAAAYRQLNLYREALDNPPLLVVCDLDRFEIHTNFTGTAKHVYSFDLEGLADPKNLDTLRDLFTEPEKLRPGLTTESITRQAAEKFGLLADGMRQRKVEPPVAAHFLMKLMFCMFGEDIGLLQGKVFSRVLTGSKKDPKRLGKGLRGLFEAMREGGSFGADEIPWFNGGLFDDAEVVELRPDDIEKLLEVNQYDWANVEPSIFGTLFERTLDPAKRSQIGAHYTSREDILTLLEPVVMAPLRREWEEVRAKCDKLWRKVEAAARKSAGRKTGRMRVPRSKERERFERPLLDFAGRLAHVKILDPACGSGNFLYVAINLLLDLEKEVIAYGAHHDVSMAPHVRPTQLAGIEINPYAQQLAQVVIWIGYLQWMYHNRFNAPRDPVLEPIESIRLMDAILDLSDPENPKEPEWPEADCIVGNPPFLGDKKMRGELGDDYVERLRKLYSGRLAGQSDLCCYWFEKAREEISNNRCKRAGLLGTQGIRGGANRQVLNRIKESGDIFFGVSDRNWVLDGAHVHVALVGFDDGSESSRFLDSAAVSSINSQLTATADVGTALRLGDNSNLGFIGVAQKAPFDLPDVAAREMLFLGNPHGRPNSDVVRPICNAQDITREYRRVWNIDFGLDMPLGEAAKYEAPFRHVKDSIYPIRINHREKRQARYWWLFARPCPDMRAGLDGLPRFIATPRVSKHRVFAWLAPEILCDSAVVAFARSDDYYFGILHSLIHELWARSQGTQVRERESGFRYTPSTCFERFPFPAAREEQKAAIAEAAKELDRLRNNWLNPREWTREEVLEFPGTVGGPWARYVHDPDERGIGTVRYPRIVAKDEECAKGLKRRTLTNLYNERPTWLDLAHKRLDEAVFAAYGWDAEMSDEQLLAKLLNLNLQRAGA